MNRNEAYLLACQEKKRYMVSSSDPKIMREQNKRVMEYYKTLVRDVDPITDYYPPAYDFHMEKFSHGNGYCGYWVQLSPNNTLYAYDYEDGGYASYGPEESKKDLEKCLHFIRLLSDEFPQIFRVVYDHVKDNPQEAYKYIANWCKNASKKFFYCAVDVGQEFLWDNRVYPSLSEFRNEEWLDRLHGRHHGVWVKLLPNNSIEVGSYSEDGEAVVYPDQVSTDWTSPYKYLKECFCTIVNLSSKYPQVFKLVYLHINGNPNSAYNRLAEWCKRYAQKYLECVIDD